MRGLLCKVSVLGVLGITLGVGCQLIRTIAESAPPPTEPAILETYGIIDSQVDNARYIDGFFGIYIRVGLLDVVSIEEDGTPLERLNSMAAHDPNLSYFFLESETVDNDANTRDNAYYVHLAESKQEVGREISYRIVTTSLNPDYSEREEVVAFTVKFGEAPDPPPEPDPPLEPITNVMILSLQHGSANNYSADVQDPMRYNANYGDAIITDVRHTVTTNVPELRVNRGGRSFVFNENDRTDTFNGLQVAGSWSAFATIEDFDLKPDFISLQVHWRAEPN